MTEKLYWKEPYSREFSARILKKEKGEEGFRIILNKTLFYPTSGGQLCDKGWINNIEVLEVFEEGDSIIHVLKVEPEGEIISGKIDWERRFENMQQHTGQHILSQAFWKVFKAETLSSNLGEEASVIELSLDRMDWKEVHEVESYANKIVYENREVISHFVKGEEWRKFALRKPPPKDEEIRIVEIKDFDFSACGGTHLARTGEVGLIKITGWEKIRNNIRVEFLCGLRAFKDFQMKHRIFKELSQCLTVGVEELKDSVLRIKEELIRERKKVSKIEEVLLEFEIKELLNSQHGIIVEKTFQGMEIKNLRKLSSRIVERRDCFVILGNMAEKANILVARSENLKLDLREIWKSIEKKGNVKGGGNESFIQLAVDTELLEFSMEEIKSEILKRIENLSSK